MRNEDRQKNVAEAPPKTMNTPLPKWHHRTPTITHRAGHYVSRLLISRLASDLLYHNLHHTLDVVHGVLAIGGAEAVSLEEMEVLILAAWFHDTGLTVRYLGHEAVSAEIARAFLLTEDYSAEKIAVVEGCILATQMPQHPRTQPQEILCDADLYHLAHPTYAHSQELLREEWKRILSKAYTDEQWHEENEAFLRAHQYFTRYGRTVLQPLKERYGLH